MPTGYYLSWVILYLCSSIGILKVKLEPIWYVDYTAMSPFNRCKIIFEIVNPSPIPPLLICLDLAICPKNLKRRLRSFGWMPMPVSSTWEISTPLMNYNLIVIPPSNVNLRAFPMMLNIIYLNRFWSDSISSGTSSSTFTWKRSFFYYTWKSITSQTSFNASRILKSSFNISNLSFSILLISKASSMTFWRCRAEFKIIVR